MNKRETELARELARKIVKGTALEYGLGNDVHSALIPERSDMFIKFAGRGVSVTVDRGTAELLVPHGSIARKLGWNDLPESRADRRWRRAYEKRPYMIGPEGPPAPHHGSRVPFSCSMKDRTRVSKLRKAILGWFRKLYEHDRREAVSRLKAVNKKLARLENRG